MFCKSLKFCMEVTLVTLSSCITRIFLSSGEMTDDGIVKIFKKSMVRSNDHVVAFDIVDFALII